MEITEIFPKKIAITKNIDIPNKDALVRLISSFFSTLDRTDVLKNTKAITGKSTFNKPKGLKSTNKEIKDITTSHLFDGLKALMNKEAYEYASSVLNREVKLIPKKHWVNYQVKGDKTNLHNHVSPNGTDTKSFVVGCYIKLPKEAGNIYFKDAPNFSRDVLEYHIEEDSIVCWPSEVFHRTEESTTTEPKIMIVTHYLVKS